MNQQFAKEAFDQTEKLLKGSPGNVQALAEKGVAATQELCAKTAAALQQSARAVTEIAETAWGSAKMLNEKAAQNLAANVDAAFLAARGLAAAQSLSEAAKLQTDFIQKLSVQASEQTKEFVDLSTRATQHVFEKVQSAATASWRRPL
jgi:hypothetical protein